MTLRAIVGHRVVVSLLSRAIARETLPPAMLLAGTAGIGKRRVAVAAAAAINCLQPRTASAEGASGTSTLTLERDACGECPSCRRIGRGVHPDVIVVEPGDSGAIKIEQIRDVIDRTGFRPFEGRRRVVIIDEADALVPQAQNALLKTLEEPPSSSVFILVSSMPDSLLPTVLSRCPRLRFGDLSAPEVATVLMREHEYGEADARAVAADADGSVARALASDSADLTEARDAAQRLLERTARVEPSRRLDAARDLTASKATGVAERNQLAACLRAVSSLLRDLGMLAVRADTGAIANSDLQDQLGRLTTAYDSERTMRAFAAVDEALAALERNASPKIVADWLVLRL